jgi:hypothetical protein
MDDVRRRSKERKPNPPITTMKWRVTPRGVSRRRAPEIWPAFDRAFSGPTSGVRPLCFKTFVSLPDGQSVFGMIGKLGW